MNEINTDEWTRQNVAYWNTVSTEYDSLYETTWSKKENDYLITLLTSIISRFSTPSVLDLGCGTGLGYNLIRKVGEFVNYSGVDISVGMISGFKSKHINKSGLHIIKGKMSDLNDFESNSKDLVFSIFASFSFTEDIMNSVREVKRVLRDNGRVLISILSKYSLRRLCRLKYGSIEMYKTRMSVEPVSTPCRTYSSKEIEQLFEVAGFSNIKVIGYNAFSGVFEFPLLWKSSTKLSKLFPNLSHELIVTAKL